MEQQGPQQTSTPEQKIRVLENKLADEKSWSAHLEAQDDLNMVHIKDLMVIIEQAYGVLCNVTMLTEGSSVHPYVLKSIEATRPYAMELAESEGSE